MKVNPNLLKNIWFNKINICINFTSMLFQYSRNSVQVPQTSFHDQYDLTASTYVFFFGPQYQQTL